MQLSLSCSVSDASTFQLGKNMAGVTIFAYFNRLVQASNFEEPGEIIRFAGSAPQTLHGKTTPDSLALRHLCFQAKTTLTLDGNEREDLLSQGSLPLSDLLTGLQSAREQDSSSPSLDIPVQLYDHSMVTPDNEPIARGAFRLRVHAPPPTGWSVPVADLAQSRRDDRQSRFGSRIAELLSAFETMPDDYGVTAVWPQAALMRVPFFRTNLLTIPAAFYVWRKPSIVSQPDVIPLYVAQYETLLEASLAFHGNLAMERFSTVLNAFIGGAQPHWHDVHMACRVAANVFTLQATAMNYESDRTVGDRLSERFKIPRNGDNGGDCEDLAKEIHLSVELFLDIGDAQRLTGVLLSMYRLCCCYVWTMLSGMVSSPSIDQQPAKANDPQFGNHIFAGAIPRTYFLHLVESTLSQPMVADLQQKLYARQSAVPDESRLRQMVLEGTGWSNPLPNAWSSYVDDDASALRQVAIAKQRAVQSVEATSHRRHPGLRKYFKSELHQRTLETTSRNPLQAFSTVRELSPFYQYLISLWVNLRRFGISSHCDFLVIDQQTKKYGVDYRQWVAQDAAVRLLPQFQVDGEQERAVCWALSGQEPFVRPSSEPIVVRHNRVTTTSPAYQPFSHAEADLFTPLLFYNLRSRRPGVLDEEPTKTALRHVLEDPNVFVQHVESTEVTFPGKEKNHLYTLDIRLYA